MKPLQPAKTVPPVVQRIAPSPKMRIRWKTMGQVRLLRRRLRETLQALRAYRRRYRTQLVISALLAVAAAGATLWRGGAILFAFPTQDMVAITTQAEFDEGTYTDTVSTNVTGGEVQLNGDGGAGWFDANWQKRKPVTITNTGSAQTNYQVRLAVTYDADMQADFDDLRFADADGTPLDFWLQSKTDIVSAVVWVEVATLAGSGDTTIYIYYSNAIATSASNGVNTFQLFDDFDDGSIDAGKWTEADPNSKISESGGKLRFIYGSGSGAWNAGVYAVSAFARSDLSFDWDQRWISDYSPYDAFMFSWKDDGAGVSYTNLVYGYYNSGSESCTINCTGNIYEDGNFRGTAGTWSKDVDYQVRVRMRASGGAYYEKSTDGESWTTDYTSTYSTESTLHPAWMHYSGDYLIDNARVRKWMATEPSSVFGAEESALPASGTWTSAGDANALDVIWNGGWSNNANGNAFEATVTLPLNTDIDFELRISTDRATWTGWYNMTDADANAGRYGVAAATLEAQFPQATYVDYRFLQIRATLTQTDGSSNPTLADVSISYLKDVDPPSSNPTEARCYNDGGLGTEYTTNTWYNDASIYCTWSGAADAHSGVTGYYVYFGTNASADPVTAGASQGTATYTLSGMTSGQTYYLRIKTYDRVGNTTTTTYQGFIYRFDSTPPQQPGVVAANPAGYTNVNLFTFLWAAGTDGDSGVAGYLYKTGAAGASDTFTTQTSVSGITAYQDNVNLFYVRARDVAGNASSAYAQVNYYYNGTAPSEPQNLQVSPTTNTVNSFTFTWNPPAVFTGSIASYHYSVNALPTAQNTSTTTATTLGPGPYATQQGVNTFYVVAKDAAGNVNYNAYASVEFTANTTAPGIPTGITMTDSSIRGQQKYSLTITWDEPANVGSGIDHYVIERSTDLDCAAGSGTFAEIATTTTTGYLDANLSNTATYCYRVKASDNADAISAASSIVSAMPEGRYTSPPTLLGSRGVEVRIQSAVVEWLTDREANSFVQFGETSNYGSETGQDDFVTTHSVTLLDLDPNTTYSYRVKYTDQDGNTGYSSDATFTTADAPSAPTDLTVDPASNTQNSFTFTWDPPADEGVTIQGYFYSINDVPSETNTSFTAQTSLGPGPYATRQGANTFYVVAMDNENNVNYQNYASVEFSATTPAPPIPTGLIITDASNRETEDYSIALKWKASTSSTNTPQSLATSDVTYVISRSTDGETFSDVAQITTTGYLDVDLSNTTTYYYRVRAKDSADSASAASTTVSEIPEGRYTTPPEITQAPILTAKSFQAVIQWKTERPTTSFVQFGTGRNALTEEQGTSTLVADHEITVAGLSPATTYYYRVKSVDVDGNVSYSSTASFATLEAPRVSDVAITDIRLYAAYLTWRTNLPTTTAVEYGPTTAYGFTQADPSGSRTTTHALKLERLTDDTTYHVRFRGADEEGTPVSSDDYVFTTLTFPKVLSTSWENQGEGETLVRWTTNVPTTSQVEYYNPVTVPRTQGNTARVTDHAVLLFGLEDATVYQFKVRGSDQFGYEAVSSEQEFRTLEDTTPPIITNVKAESNTIGSGEGSRIQIIVQFSTDEPTSTQARYGEGSAATPSDLSELNPELVYDHLLVISDLAPARTYVIQAVATDKAGNLTTSDTYRVLTSRRRESFLNLVLDQLETTFAWLANLNVIGQ